MKKKIALLLAVIMTMSLMPMTVFAGSNNYLAKGTITLKPDVPYDGNLTGPDVVQDGNLAIQNALVIEFKDEIPNSASGQKFRIELTNAEFSNVNDASKGAAAGTFKYPAQTYTGKWVPAAAKWATNNLGGAGVAEIDELGNEYSGLATSSTGLVVSRAAIVGRAALPGGSLKAEVIPEGIANVATVTVYQAPKDSKMVIYLPIKTADVDDADVSVAISANNSYVSSGTFLLSRTAKGNTSTTVKTIRTGRELIEVNNILIKESLTGSLKNLSMPVAPAREPAIELVAPSGFEFTGIGSMTPVAGKIPGVDVVGTGEFASLRIGDKELRHKATSLLIGFDTSSLPAGTVSTVLPETIIITGVKLQPIDNDVVTFNTVLQMGVYKYQGTITSTVGGPANSYEALDGLTEQTFDAIKPVDWAVSVTAATAKDVVTGRFDSRVDAEQQIAAKVTFKELIKEAWLPERTTEFRLPEGVSIRGVKFDDWDYLLQSNPAASTKHALSGAGSNVTGDYDIDKWSITAPKTTGTTDGIVTVNKNLMTLKNFQAKSGEKAVIGFTLYLSVSPEYAGDTIALTTGGTAIQQDELPDVVIANVVKPVTVSVSKVTDVQIGFQRYAVGDIIIKENAAGAIKRNIEPTFADGALTKLTAPKEGLTLSIEDYISTKSDMEIVPITMSQVTVDGDLKIALRKTTSGTIAFDVDRMSTSTPSTITIKGVEIKINRTVPYGVYDLVVAGQSVYANQSDDENTTKDQINSLFDVHGYSTPYINVATEGMNSPLKNNVKIAKDSDIVIVDGVQQQMAYPTYFDVSQSSFLVPARFISHIFGVEENNIFWNDTTKTVSIITANRTIQFTANSNVMVVGANGAPSNVTMTAKAILHPVTERLYVPFRAIGDAFGVPVTYDETTQMGEYNAVVK